MYTVCIRYFTVIYGVYIYTVLANPTSQLRREAWVYVFARGLRLRVLFPSWQPRHMTLVNLVAVIFARVKEYGCNHTACRSVNLVVCCLIPTHVFMFFMFSCIQLHTSVFCVTLLILVFPLLCAGGASQRSVTKWLLSLNQCGEWLPLLTLFFCNLSECDRAWAYCWQPYRLLPTPLLCVAIAMHELTDTLQMPSRVCAWNW